MKPKAQRRLMKKFWRLEYKSFINSMGELNLENKGAIPFKTRFRLAIAILKAPGLARKGKLVDYLNKRWDGKGLKEQHWTEYEKVTGLIRFKCRTQKEKQGELVQILVNETWWSEEKALKLLNKDQIKIYNEGMIK